MTTGRRLAAGLLLVAALALAVLGQIYFFQRREYLWDGLVLHGLAALCFVWAWQLSLPPRPQTAPQRSGALGGWLREHPIPAALLALGLFLSFVAALLLQGRTVSQPTHDVALLWLLATAAVGLAAFWPPRWPGDWRARLGRVRRETWLEAATVAALTALAFTLRVAALDRVPFTLGGDEAWHGLLARQVLHGRIGNPFNMGYMSMPTGFYWPLSWSLWLMGDTMTGLRFPAALVGTLTVPILYLFARDLWGRRTALLAALFLAAYDYHIHYSRLGANNVWDPLFVILALWALERGIGNRGLAGPSASRFFLLAGLVMGLSTLFYTGARLLPVLVVVYAGFFWIQRRCKVEGLGRHLLLLGLAFLAAAGPMLSYALSHPDEWNARVNQVGIVQSGWLEREPELTGKSTPQILAEQFLRSAGAFHVFADRTVWYGAERPLLGFGAGVFVLLGMAWAMARWRDRRYFLVLIWFWSVIVSGGMLTESPPSSQRLVIAIPAVALLAAFGLEQSVRLARRLIFPSFEGAERGKRFQQGEPSTPIPTLPLGEGGSNLGRKWENVALILLVLLLAVSSVRFYFVEFTPTRCYGSANGETATMIGHYLQGLEGDDQVFLLTAPRFYWNFGTMAFLAPRVSGQDVVEPLAAPPDFALAGSEGRDAVFILLPERREELVWIKQAFPDGRLREFYDPLGRLRFLAYEVMP